ncbi:hypothetical protein GCM10009558_082440 [Virgisporangium aurantiacum]
MRSSVLIAVALLALGVGGLASYPLTPHPDPTFVTMRSGGSVTEPAAVEVAHAGTHAIWATGAVGPCRVTTADGGAAPVAEPRPRAEWVSRAEGEQGDSDQDATSH